MTQAELGKRIKEARLAKKMTQSEVVGTFITRNMLSQIESGAASPSIKTLEYIANALDIPLNQLMTDDNNTAAASPAISGDAQNTYIAAKKKYQTQDYIAVIQSLEPMLSENNSLYDETAALLAITYYRQAQQDFKEHIFNQSIAYAKKSVALSTKGLFANTELKTKALLLLDELLEHQFANRDETVADFDKENR